MPICGAACKVDSINNNLVNAGSGGVVEPSFYNGSRNQAAGGEIKIINEIP